MYRYLTGTLLCLALDLTPRASLQARRRNQACGDSDTRLVLLSHRLLAFAVGEARAELYLVLRAERRYGRIY